MKLLLSIAFLAFATVASAAPQSTLAAAKPLQAPKCELCECGCVDTGKCQCKNCNEHTADPKFLHAHKPPQGPTSRYQHAIETAKDNGTPLVTFVSCNSEPVPGFTVTQASVAELDGQYPKGCAVVSVFEGGKHLAYATILNPTAEKIAAAKPHKVSVCENGHCRLTYFPPAPIVQSSACGMNGCFGGDCSTGNCGQVSGGCPNGQCGSPASFSGFPAQSFGGCANGQCGQSQQSFGGGCVNGQCGQSSSRGRRR